MFYFIFPLLLLASICVIPHQPAPLSSRCCSLGLLIVPFLLQQPHLLITHSGNSDRVLPQQTPDLSENISLSGLYADLDKKGQGFKSTPIYTRASLALVSTLQGEMVNAQQGVAIHALPSCILHVALKGMHFRHLSHY